MGLKLNAVKDFFSVFRPEGPVLSAQAEGLGITVIRMSGLKGPFTVSPPEGIVNDPFRVEFPIVRIPGLRPGLTEPAFQAGNSSRRCLEVSFRTEVLMPQSLAKVYAHAIFSTKNREPVLFDEWRDELFRVIGGAINNLGCQSLIVGGTTDHVHVLFQLSRTITIADAVGKIKSTSSAWVNQNHPGPVSFHWQSGYAIFSVSQSNVDAVREYIRKQPEHHAKQSFQDELREWLRRYEIEWDERYVWD